MKNQGKYLIILLVLFAAALAAFFGLKKYNKIHASDDESTEPEYTICSMDSAKVDKLTVTVNGTALHFSKKGDDWIYDDDTSVELDQTKMSGIVSNLYKCSSTVKIDKPTDLVQYGLGDTAIPVEITAGDKTVKLTIGSLNSMISKYYIMKDGDTSVYAISGENLSSLSGGIDSLKASAETTTAASETAAETTTTVASETASETTTAESSESSSAEE